jgi:hypothetical protein
VLSQLLLASNVYLFALAIVVQLAVYKNFVLIPHDAFRIYHERYSKTIALAVGPAWILQGVTTAILVVHKHAAWRTCLQAIGALGGVAVTVFLAVPTHRKLEQHGSNIQLFKVLQRANLMRIALWALCVGATI